MKDLLQHRQARQQKHAKTNKAATPANDDGGVPAPLYRTLKEQRSLLNSLVGLWSKTSNEPHGLIHAELRRICGGPAVAQASVTQLQARIVTVRKWMSAGH